MNYSIVSIQSKSFTSASISLLLSQLTTSPILPINQYTHIIDNLPDNQYIYVCECGGSPIGMISLMIEQNN